MTFLSLIILGGLCAIILLGYRLRHPLLVTTEQSVAWESTILLWLKETAWFLLLYSAGNFLIAIVARLTYLTIPTLVAILLATFLAILLFVSGQLLTSTTQDSTVEDGESGDIVGMN